MSRFLVLRVNRDPSDTYAVPYHGHEGESVYDALDVAIPDEGSRVEYAIVEARDAGSARLARGADWETVPWRWVQGWHRDMPDVLQGHEMKQLSDKTTIEELARTFDLPSWDRIDELNQEFYWQQSHGAEDEEAQLEAEREAQEEVFATWYDAVESAVSKLFEAHGLELKGVTRRKGERRPFELKIIPTTSWTDAANKIRETINGVGSFYYRDLREFLSSGPYTPRQAVLSHLQWIKRYPDVYGTTSAHRLYENAWR